MALSAADLATMRAAQSAALPDTATVKRRVQTADTVGGTTYTWPSATATLACRLSSRGVPSTFIELYADRNAHLWMVTFANGANVLAGDRLVIGSRTMQVIGFASGGEWQTALRAVCVEVV